jgi:hypothetical protein
MTAEHPKLIELRFPARWIVKIKVYDLADLFETQAEPLRSVDLWGRATACSG